MNAKLLCHPDKTLLDAIEAININARGMVFIVDDDNKLYGVLTDGDIRRVILEGRNLQERISGVIKKDFVYATQEESLESRMAKLNERINFLPIVDRDFRLVDYIEFKHDVHVPIVSPDLNGNELKYLVEAFLSSWISSSGKYITDFEHQFARFCQCSHGVATSNGTTALHLALLACGIKPKDEVIVPDLTFAATINAVLHAGATPVIVDVEPESWCMDPQEIKKAITPRTRAILPVHLYGQPCDMDAIMKIAQAHKLFVVEDCAQAHGAEFNNKKVGSFGDIGCFSFFGNKVITTGEGGMCVTRSAELEDRMKILRDHGMSRTKKYWHDVIGFNYRMTNLQAAIGLAQLERIDNILKQRHSVEKEYRRLLADVPYIEFQNNTLARRKKITWLVTALIKNGERDLYMSKLKESGIDVRSLFYPLSAMDIYRPYVFSCSVSQAISRAGVSFPTGASVDPSVIKRIRDVFAVC